MEKGKIAEKVGYDSCHCHMSIIFIHHDYSPRTLHFTDVRIQRGKTTMDTPPSTMNSCRTMRRGQTHPHIATVDL